MSEQKKEFKVGDEVWFIHDGRVKVDKVGSLPEYWFDTNTTICTEFYGNYIEHGCQFHTPQELLENIKQQIDNINDND